MAKAMYVGVNNVVRKAKRPYIGVDAVTRKASKGHIGVDNVTRTFFTSGFPISELTKGDSVYINVGGTPTEFIIIYDAAPPSIESIGKVYDSSTDGIWLLMKDIHKLDRWNTADVLIDYNNSSIHNYLNGQFLNSLDMGVRNKIKAATLPYTNYNNEKVTISTQVFLLSDYEVGRLQSYFAGQYENCIAYYNGAPYDWWLRDVSTGTMNGVRKMSAKFVNTSGSYNSSAQITYSYGIRPALILPHDALVDDDFNVL